MSSTRSPAPPVLPSYQQAHAAVTAGTATPLELFLWNWETAGPAFRVQLALALEFYAINRMQDINRATGLDT